MRDQKSSTPVPHQLDDAGDCRDCRFNLREAHRAHLVKEMRETHDAFAVLLTTEARDAMFAAARALLLFDGRATGHLELGPFESVAG